MRRAPVGLGLPVSTSIEAVLARLAAHARVHADEVAVAAHALLQRAPSPADSVEVIAFYGLEWVDGGGLTALQHLVAAGELSAEVLPWSHDVRVGLWVVDGWEGDLACIRDLATDEELVLFAPSRATELLPRSVLRARLVPDLDTPGRWRAFGEMDVWGPRGVLGRMDLLRAWQEGHEPALHARLAELRGAFRRQREERATWIAHFGADLVVFDDADAMAAGLSAFVNVLLNGTRFESLGGRTRAEAFRAAKGEEPAVIQFALGGDLSGPGRHGAIYDDHEGIHVLPRLGDFLAHLRGESHHPEVVRAYLDDPGVTWLPFRRAGATRALAEVLGAPDATLEALLLPVKGPPRRAAPSVLPGFED